MTLPSSGTSICASRCTAKAGTFSKVTRCTLPSFTSARTAIGPAGDSSRSSVVGSLCSTMPVSIRTVVTAMVLVPDMPGYSTCSMIT